MDWLFTATAFVESHMVRRGGVPITDVGRCRSAYRQLEALYEIDAASCPNTWGLSPNEFGYYGNRRYAVAYLTRGDGSVPTLSDPDMAEVAARERSVTDRKPRNWMLSDALFLENPYSFPDPGHQFALKRNMVLHGPADAKMYYDPAYLKSNGSERSYYCPDKQIEPDGKRLPDTPTVVSEGCCIFNKTGVRAGDWSILVQYSVDGTERIHGTVAGFLFSPKLELRIDVPNSSYVGKSLSPVLPYGTESERSRMSKRMCVS